MVPEPSDDDGTRSDNNAQPTRRGYLGTAGAIVGASALLSGNALAGDKKKPNDGLPTPDDVDVPDDTSASSPLRVIDEPGIYLLQSDIEVESSETGVLILSEDVTLLGNGNTISGDGSGVGVFVDGEFLSDNVTIADIEFEDLGRAVELFEPNFCRIIDIVAEDCSTGVFQSNDADDNRIITSEFFNSPLTINQSGSTVAIGNIIEGSDGNGVSLSDEGNHIFVDNVISGHAEAGVSIGTTDNNTFVRNEITDNGTFGLELVSSDGNTFLDNDLSDNDEGPCSVDGLDNIFEGNDPECDPDE